jgi:hypothetical protein
MNQLLWNAAQEGYSDVVEVLAGLKMVDVKYIRAYDTLKRTPLLIARRDRHSDAVHELFYNGRVDSNITHATGNLAVDAAAFLGLESNDIALPERAATLLRERCGSKRELSPGQI